MTAQKLDLTSFEKPHWSTQDRNNAESVLEFVQLLMNDHDFDEVRQRYKGSSYIQHNRNIGNQIEGVINTIDALIKRAPEFSYDVKYLYVDGEHVILHSHATLKAKHRGDESQGMNIVDIWKVVDGKLIEHWDAVQGLSFSMRLYGLLSGGAVRNDNGIF